jgi:excisionase family DNA binding protein
VSERLLTAEELAVRLGVPAKWPLREARAGRIPHVRLGRYVRFDSGDVDRWLESVKSGGGPRGRAT